MEKTTKQDGIKKLSDRLDKLQNAAKKREAEKEQKAKQREKLEEQSKEFDNYLANKDNINRVKELSNQEQENSETAKKRKSVKNNTPKTKLPITKARRKLLDAAVEVAMTPASNEDIAFMDKALVQANLPHSKPKSDVWVRTNGRLSLVVQAGLDAKGQSYGLPYGTIPRLGLLYITTTAVRTKSRRIELGKTLNDFIRAIGLSPETGRGKRGDAKRLIEQMNRLFNARFSFTETTTDQQGNTGQRRLNMQVASKSELWWNIHNPEQHNIFSSWLELGEDFYNAIIATPIPIDFRAALALKQSPLALDIYILLCFEAFKAHKKKQAHFIPWAALFEQMGSSYGDVKDFKKRFKAALKKVRTVAPMVHVVEESGGIRIVPESLPAISEVVHKPVIYNPPEG